MQVNSKWITEVYENPAVSNFLDEMINIKNSVTITPASAVTLIDDSPYCWVFLAYHSKYDVGIAKGIFLNSQRVLSEVV